MTDEKYESDAFYWGYTDDICAKCKQPVLIIWEGDNVEVTECNCPNPTLFFNVYQPSKQGIIKGIVQ